MDVADPLIDLLDQAVREADPPRLAVALSGGLDSSALAHALSRSVEARRRGLRAIHVDHGLHAEAACWSAQVAEDCRRWSIPFLGLRCEVARDSGLGIEAAAREARYAVLAQALKPGEWLALAHHRDDQAETVLLRLLRGAGTAALGGMRATRPLGPGMLWRPLLDVPRDALHAYATVQRLRWIEDPSNTDPRHDRSWLRRQVMPLLTQRWPQASAGIARSAGLLRADGDLLADQAQAALTAVRGETDTTLRISALRALSPALRAHALRAWLRECAADPLPGRLHDALEHLLQDDNPDGQPLLRWRGSVLRRHRDRLHLEALDPAPAVLAETLQWDGCAPLILPDGGSLRFQPALSAPADFRVGTRQGGERIRLPGRRHRHRLKHVLQDSGLPPWQRSRLPLLWRDGELLAAGDQLLSDAMQDWLAREGRRYVWMPPLKS